MKNKITRIIKKRHLKRDSVSNEGLSENVPRITNETVASHREEVLGRARKYILPLQHTKHKIVVVSMAIFLAVIVLFFSYCMLALYKFKDSSTFLYRVTQVVPFPVARVGGKFVAYENYLFELRRYTHYYENQLKLNFNDPQNRQQLVDYRTRALNQVVNYVYAQELAKQHNITVSDKEIDQQIHILQSQKRLGDNNHVFEDVLRDYWGWSINDFRRELRSVLLVQKVVVALDTTAHQKAETALEELKNGASFATVAKRYSEDIETKAKGGEYGYPISQNGRLSPQVTSALFALKEGQYSGIVNDDTSLEIVKNIERKGNKIRAAHIVIKLKDINYFINDLKDQQNARLFIKI